MIPGKEVDKAPPDGDEGASPNDASLFKPWWQPTGSAIRCVGLPSDVLTNKAESRERGKPQTLYSGTS